MERRTFLGVGLAAAAGVATRPLDRFANPRPTPYRADLLRLSSNENALGPSAAARQAVADALTESNRYTHRVAADLQSRIAEHHGVPTDAVVLGNGSAEILQMATQAVARPGGRVVMADPTFEQVFGYGEPFGIERIKVPLTAAFAHDIGRMRDAARGADGPVLAYICNPNNPTGSLTSCDEVEAWIRDDERTLFLVDEAYFEYVRDPGYRTALPLATTRPNVAVVRTFSKIYGMAGLRLGYAIAHPDTAARIDAFAANSNLNIMGLVAARASLGDESHLLASRRSNDRAREVTEQILDELDLARIPSHTNFVMHRVPGDLETYIERMADHQVRVGRPFPPMTGYNRLSFGLPEEMERFGEVLRDFRRRGWV
jgi:histidinol-phosphate aminotransferase